MRSPRLSRTAAITPSTGRGMACVPYALSAVVVIPSRGQAKAAPRPGCTGEARWARHPRKSPRYCSHGCSCVSASCERHCSATAAAQSKHVETECTESLHTETVHALCTLVHRCTFFAFQLSPDPYPNADGRRPRVQYEPTWENGVALSGPASCAPDAG